jgi:hypothetical protein
MQSEKTTPYEALKKDFEYLKQTNELLDWLKNAYKQDLESKKKEIELYKKGLQALIEPTFLDLEKEKNNKTFSFSELQMLN